MKKLIFALSFIFISFLAKAQTGSYTLVPGNWQYSYVKVTTGFQGPQDTLALAQVGSLAVKGTTLYIKGSDNIWHAITGAGGSGVWGFISGVLSDQTDLVAALGKKLDTVKRKMDTLYAITDSTFGYYINSQFRTFKARGTLTSFNGRGGAIILNVSDVSSALGFVPQNLSALINQLQVINAGNATSVQVDVIANRPAFGTFGRIFIATDNQTLSVDIGTSWVTIAGGSGGGVTSATGDAAGTASGSVLPLTLATVNGNIGSFGDATHVAALTTNAKGLITAASSISIQIAESQVTGLVSDLAGKQAVGSYITSTTGDVTSAGPGAAAAAVVRLRGIPITATSPSNGQIPSYNSGANQINWIDPPSGSGSDSGIVAAVNSAIFVNRIAANNRQISFAGDWQVVTKYPGVVGDSTTDCVSGFQAAIDYITAHGKRGVIYIPNGIYFLGSNVTIPFGTNITFLGAGNSTFPSIAGSICKIWYNSTTGDGIVDNAANTNFVDFDILNNATTPTDGAAIHTTNASPQIRNVTFEKCFYGVHLENNSYPSILNCSFVNDVQYDIYNHNDGSPDNGDATIDNCKFSAAGVHSPVAAFWQTNSGGAKIRGCKVNGLSYQYGYVANLSGTSNRTSDFVVDGGSIENWTVDGILITTDDDASFENVTIGNLNISSYRSGVSGIKLFGGTGTLARVAIGNVDINDVTNGIEYGNIDNLSISNIVFDNITNQLLNNGNTTNFYYDKNVVTHSSDGQMAKQDKKNLDSLYIDSSIMQFHNINNTSDTLVLDQFGYFTSDINGNTPAINQGGAWTQIFGSGFTTAQTDGFGNVFNHATGTGGYFVDGGRANQSVSLKFTTAAWSGSFKILARGTDANNYLEVYITPSDFVVGQVVSGTETNLFDNGANPLANNDVVRIDANGDNWTLFINNSQISTGTFDGTDLTGHGGGFMFVASTVATTFFTNFLITSIPNSDGSWGITHDTTLFGRGTPSSPLKTRLTQAYVDSVVGSKLAPTLYYQTVQANGSSMTQRPKLNFGPEFTPEDDAPFTSTDIILDHLGSGVTATTQSPGTNNTTVSTTAYADAAVAAALTQPFSDGTPLVKNSSDATKTLTIGTNNIPTGTNRTQSVIDGDGTLLLNVTPSSSYVNQVSTAQTVATLSITGTNFYKVGGILNVTGAIGATVTMKVSWTDNHNNAQTYTWVTATTTGCLPQPDITIFANTGSITIATTITGTPTYDCKGTIIKLD